jgi:hypoxanthine phosphoribosyltransferase
MPDLPTSAVFISRDKIRDRIAELGRQISTDYSGKTLTIIGILKGSFVFLADLAREIHPEVSVEIDFIAASSYGNAMTSSGTVHIEKDVEVAIQGKHIIIVEDIVDSGLTLMNVHNILEGRGASSIRVATLLHKPGNSKYNRQLDYVGFEIPNRFVIGYGLDYAQRYRNLPDICVLNEI